MTTTFLCYDNHRVIDSWLQYFRNRSAAYFWEIMRNRAKSAKTELVWRMN